MGEMGFNGNDDAQTLLLRGNGRGEFAKEVVAAGYGHHESRLADLDGDGDLDILGKPYALGSPGLTLWLNQGITALPLDRWVRHSIDPARPHRAVFVAPADLDRDGYPDLVTGAWWYRNPGTIDGVWQRRTIGVSFDQFAAVHDFDEDGDADLLGTVHTGVGVNGSAFVWARNDGSGAFEILDNITPGDGDFLQGVAVGPLAAGGGLAVALSWHQGGKGIQMLTVPADPGAETWAWARIADTAQDEALSLGDVDRDGAQDLLLGTTWLRQTGAQWEAYALHDTGDLPDRNVLADINADGRLDAVVGYEKFSGSGTLAWYEQGSEAREPWTAHPIADLVGPMSVDVADLDADGDLDVVVGEHNTGAPQTARLVVYANVDGEGTQWEPFLVWTGDEHHDGTQVIDLDRDGDLDIVSIGWTHDDVLVYENVGGLGHRVFLPTIWRR